MHSRSPEATIFWTSAGSTKTHTHTHEGSGDENGTGGEFKNRTDVAKVLCFAVSQMQPLSYSL